MNPQIELRPENGDWKEYKRLVIDRLDEMRLSIKELREDFLTQASDVVALKTKLALIGVVSGMVGSGAVALIVEIFARLFRKP